MYFKRKVVLLHPWYFKNLIFV